MGRNLFILASTLGGLALLSIVVSFTNIAGQPGSPGDALLWRTTGIALFAVALIIGLAGILSTLFGQAERRAEANRQVERKRRREAE